ncbi:DUF2523 family protein [Lysobacter antibioticus]|uniref:DUF2523 family protein n=1 Tax=Lysobacter antibioticus TaxID=84531 RepID=UPI0007E8C69D|nr:DUF2523 family protein [Lysobacter antibioticus]
MPLIIGALVSALLNALRTYLPGIVGRVLLAIGIGAAVKEVALPALLGLIQAKVGTLPSLLLAYFGALKLDIAITLILSAMAAKATQKVMLAKLG